MRRKYEITITSTLASPTGEGEGPGRREGRSWDEEEIRCYWKRWREGKKDVR